MILSRFVREIGFRMLENEGYIGLHASAIEMDSQGYILPYIKEQGKKETDSVYQIVKRNCYYKKEPVYVEDWLGINIKRDFWSYEKIMDELLHLNIYRAEISISEFRKSAENIVHLIENSKEMGAR